MKQKFISKTVGKRLAIGGGAVFTVALVTLFMTLQSVYGIVGTCDANCSVGLVRSELLVRLALWAIVISAAATIAGIVIMQMAKSNKETTNK